MTDPKVSILEDRIRIRAGAETIFDEICDIEARSEDLPAFERVQIGERSADGFVATMYERYGGREVVITSQFRFERPRWVTYEHLQGPYGENRGRFTITETEDGCVLHQTHETSQDVSEGTELRKLWAEMISQQLEAIRVAAERTDAARATIGPSAATPLRPPPRNRS